MTTAPDAAEGHLARSAFARHTREGIEARRRKLARMAAIVRQPRPALRAPAAPAAVQPPRAAVRPPAGYTVRVSLAALSASAAARVAADGCDCDPDGHCRTLSSITTF